MKNPTIYPPNTLPSAKPYATVLIVHGMAEHQGRYAEFAQFLANHHFVVMTFDHLGHGEHAAQTNSLGFMGNPHPADLMIDNVMMYAKQLADNYPNLPHFIVGHSMGSFITRCILQRFGNQFDGAIIVGTASPNPLAKKFLPITKTCNRIASKKTNVVFDKIFGKVNNLPFVFEKNMQDFNWLNSDKQAVQQFINDPLCGFAFTNNGYFALMTLMEQGTNKNWWQNVPTTLPLLFISGKKDPVGQMGKGVPIIVKDLKKHGFTHVEKVLYPNMRHEILLENGKAQVYVDVLNWLLKHS